MFDQVQVGTGTSSNPAIARLSDGRSIVAWVPSDRTTDVVGRFLDASGAPIGAAFTLSSDAAGSRIGQVLAASALDGGFVLVRSRRDPPCCSGPATSTSGDTRLFRFAPDGSRVFDRSLGGGLLSSIRMQMSPDGSYALSYIMDPSRSSLAGGTRVRADGSAAYSSPSLGIHPQATSVAAFPDGALAVLWFEPDYTGPSGVAHIFYQLIDATGQTVGSPVPVANSDPAMRLAAAALPNGLVAVAWSSNDPAPGGGQTNTTVLNRDGSSAGPVRVSSFSSPIFGVELSATANDYIVGAQLSAGTNSAISTRRFELSGAPLADSVVLVDQATAYSTQANLAPSSSFALSAFGDGHFVSSYARVNGTIDLFASGR